MTDTTLIVAETRCAELLLTLRHAVAGTPHWRPRAAKLLRSIDDHELPEPAHAALIEIDERKRAAEIMQDLANVD